MDAAAGREADLTTRVRALEDRERRLQRAGDRSPGGGGAAAPETPGTASPRPSDGDLTPASASAGRRYRSKWGGKGDGEATPMPFMEVGAMRALFDGALIVEVVAVGAEGRSRLVTLRVLDRGVCGGRPRVREVEARWHKTMPLRVRERAAREWTVDDWRRHDRANAYYERVRDLFVNG